MLHFLVYSSKQTSLLLNQKEVGSYTHHGEEQINVKIN